MLLLLLASTVPSVRRMVIRLPSFRIVPNGPVVVEFED
jgi:hypothetical protein